MIEIKSLSGRIWASYDVESVKEAVGKAVKEGVLLRHAYLSSADLRHADLSGADLRGADLRGAYLIDADLSNASTDKRYIQVGCIGSVKRQTTYCMDDDNVWCGCFEGTLEEFEEKVKETHADNKQYLAEYMGAIEYFKSLRN